MSLAILKTESRSFAALVLIFFLDSHYGSDSTPKPKAQSVFSLANGPLPGRREGDRGYGGQHQKNNPSESRTFLPGRENREAGERSAPVVGRKCEDQSWRQRRLGIPGGGKAGARGCA